VIDYPDDRSIAAEADRHDIPEPVLVRDLVRVVEVLNLKAKDFFSERSVLAGSMALRCFDSPRFTVYDADFSTSSQAVNPATAMKDKLAYRDDDLEITPADLVPHDDGGTAWQSAPISFTPIFTSLIPDPDDRSFKADVSFRGMLLDGLEVPFKVPYELGIWEDDPAVFVMDPHEGVSRGCACGASGCPTGKLTAAVTDSATAFPPARPARRSTAENLCAGEHVRDGSALRDEREWTTTDCRDGQATDEACDQRVPWCDASLPVDAHHGVL